MEKLGSNITMHHLIALKLYIGDYRFHPLQDKLMDALHSESSVDEMRSLYHWKTSLEEAFLLFRDIRRTLNMETPVVFERDMELQCALARVFGMN